MDKEDRAVCDDLLQVSVEIDKMSLKARKDELFRLVAREFKTTETWRTRLLRLIIVDTKKRREFIRAVRNGVFILMLFCVGHAYARQGCCSWHDGVCGDRCCDGTALSDKCKP